MAEKQFANPPLLDVLWQACGCEFLSDLHYIEAERVCGGLEKIPEELFSDKEWEDAYEYLTGEFPGQGREVSKRMLLAKLQRKEKE